MSTKDRSSLGGSETAGSASVNEADAPSRDAETGPAGLAGALPGGVFPLRVRAAWDETPTLRGLRLHGPRELLQQYHTPGQYLELVHGEAGSGYFAIAAAPPAAASHAAAEDPRELELLVRRGPGLASVLAGMQPEQGSDVTLVAAVGASGASGASGESGESGESGTSGTSGTSGAPAAESAQALRTQGIRGAGFALAAQAGRDLLLVAAGSGIAPLRAVLQLLLRQRQRFGQVALYYGERTESDFAYRSELEALRAAGVTVELVLSRPPAGWRGGVGYVQDHLRALPPPWLGPGTVALLCGQSGMINDVTALLTAHQVPPSQILMNY